MSGLAGGGVDGRACGRAGGRTGRCQYACSIHLLFSVRTNLFDNLSTLSRHTDVILANVFTYFNDMLSKCRTLYSIVWKELLVYGRFTM